jgi:membrane fusion protein, multidrug efflux system
MPPVAIRPSFRPSHTSISLPWLATLAGFWGLGAGCGKSAPAAAAGVPPPMPVGVTSVAPKAIQPWTDLTGRVEAVEHVEIRARVSGYVTAVHYKEGAEVKAGDALFTIDARPYRAALARATAEHARAKARVELARTEAGRGEQLLAASAITRAERDSLASVSAQAEAELQAAAAQMQLAKLDLDFTRVRAPVAGRTGQATVSVGDYVAAGPAPTPLTTVASVDPVYVYFTGDEQTYLRFAARASDTPVSVGLADEVGYPHPGRIDFVDNKVDPSTGTIRLRAVVPNPDKRLAPGLFARVRLAETGTVTAIAIDDKAIMTDQDRKYVYRVGAGDTVERADVKLGRIVDGLRVVTDGLAAGDRVVVTSIQKVFPGAKVAPMATETTP